MNFQNSEFFKSFQEGCKTLGVERDGNIVFDLFHPKKSFSLDEVGKLPLVVRKIEAHHLVGNECRLPLGYQNFGERKNRLAQIDIHEHLAQATIGATKSHLWSLLEKREEFSPVVYPDPGRRFPIQFRGNFYDCPHLGDPHPAEATLGEFFLFSFQGFMNKPDYLFGFLLVSYKEGEPDAMGDDRRVYTRWEIGAVLVYRLSFDYSQLIDVCKDIWTLNRKLRTPFAITKPKLSLPLRKELNRRFPGLLED